MWGEGPSVQCLSFMLWKAQSLAATMGCGGDYQSKKVKKAKNEDAVGVSATILTKDGYCFQNIFYQNIIK